MAARRETEAELLPAAPTVNFNVDLDKEDVLAIGMSEAEDRMQEHLDSAMKSRNQAQEEADAYMQKAHDLLQEAAEDECEEMKKALAEAMKAMKIRNVEFTVQHHLPCRDAKGAVSKEYSCTLHCCESTDDKRRGNLQFSRTFTFKTPTDVIRALDHSRDASQQSAEYEQTAMEWKRKLTQLPRYERKLRRRLAEARLSKSKEGRELLDTMIGDVTKDVLGITHQK